MPATPTSPVDISNNIGILYLNNDSKAGIEEDLYPSWFFKKVIALR